MAIFGGNVKSCNRSKVEEIDEIKMKLGCSGGIRTEDVGNCDNNTRLEAWLNDGPLKKGVIEQGYNICSPVQSQALPLATCGIDLIVEAKSGTGKTLVFAIPALQMIQDNDFSQILILTPTREIAVQIANVLYSIGKYVQGSKVGVFIGGTDVQSDVKQIAADKCRLLVGSPGRIKHLVKDKILNLNSVRMFVLDEADKLLEESFLADVNYIFNKLPEHKQVIATSATYSESLKELLLRYTRTPAHVKPHKTAVLVGISHRLALVDHHPHPTTLSVYKQRMLLDILTRETFKQCLVFCNYQIRAQNVCKFLQQNGWPATCLSGMQTQSERLETLSRLQKFECRIVVATDLAARGLDAHNVDLVINSEIPRDLATYLHRIGRCGRYGSLGKGITIVSPEEKTAFRTFLSAIDDQCDVHVWNSSPNRNVLSVINDTRKDDSNKSPKWKSFKELIESFEEFSKNPPDSLETLEDANLFSEKNCLLNDYLNEIISNSKNKETDKKPIEYQINENENIMCDDNLYVKNIKKERKANRINKKSAMKTDKITYRSDKDDYGEWRTQLDSRIHQIQTFVYTLSLINMCNSNK